MPFGRFGLCCNCQGWASDVLYDHVLRSQFNFSDPPWWFRFGVHTDIGVTNAPSHLERSQPRLCSGTAFVQTHRQIPVLQLASGASFNSGMLSACTGGRVTKGELPNFRCSCELPNFKAAAMTRYCLYLSEEISLVQCLPLHLPGSWRCSQKLMTPGTDLELTWPHFFPVVWACGL